MELKQINCFYSTLTSCFLIHYNVKLKPFRGSVYKTNKDPYNFLCLLVCPSIHFDRYETLSIFQSHDNQPNNMTIKAKLKKNSVFAKWGNKLKGLKRLSV